MKKPAWYISLIPFIVLMTILAAVIRQFGADALEGASQVALLCASAVAVCIAILGYGVEWKTLEDAVSRNIRTIGTALLILLLIGAISGMWMVSGIVPTMMYYGLKILSPRLFLFAVCIICALVSVVTGSSWTTIATIGVAFVGIGVALGYSSAWTAGAIISGAYFGDKISPLSDTTVLAASTTGTPLFSHIRYMMITTIPSMCIACIIFLFVSLFHNIPDTLRANEFSEALSTTFNITPWLFTVPALTGLMIAKKLPALLTLFLSAIAAAVMAILTQGEIVSAIGGGSHLDWGSGFKGVMISLYGDTCIPTGNESLDKLVQTSGMSGMLLTIFLILCSATFGGVLAGSGMLQSLTDALGRLISGRTSLVASTVSTGIFCNMVAGDQYLSIILTGSLYKDLYGSKGYESKLLSRSAEDSATVTSVLIPWNSCGMTQSTVLKVRTIDYLPYCFFNYISPLMSIFVAAIGFKIVRIVSKK